MVSRQSLVLKNQPCQLKLDHSFLAPKPTKGKKTNNQETTKEFEKANDQDHTMSDTIDKGSDHNGRPTKLVFLPSKKESDANIRTHLREVDSIKGDIAPADMENCRKMLSKLSVEMVAACSQAIKKKMTDEARTLGLTYGADNMTVNSYANLKMAFCSDKLTLDACEKVFKATVTAFYTPTGQLKGGLGSIGRGVFSKHGINCDDIKDAEFCKFLNTEYTNAKAFTKKNRARENSVGLTMRLSDGEKHPIPVSGSPKSNYEFSYQKITNFETLAKMDPRAAEVLEKATPGDKNGVGKLEKEISLQGVDMPKTSTMEKVPDGGDEPRRRCTIPLHTSTVEPSPTLGSTSSGDVSPLPRGSFPANVTASMVEPVSALHMSGVSRDSVRISLTNVLLSAHSCTLTLLGLYPRCRWIVLFRFCWSFQRRSSECPMMSVT